MKIFFCSVHLFFILLLCCRPSVSFAETVFDIEQQIQKEKKSLEEMEFAISENKKRSIVSQKKERSLLMELEVIDRRFALLRKEAAMLERKIGEKEKEAKGLSERIREVTLEIEKGRKIILSRVRSIYKEKQGASLKVLFASKDYPDLLRKLQYMKTVAQKEESVLVEFKARHAELAEKKDQLSEVVERMIVDREALAQKIVQSRSERKKKDVLIVSVRKDKVLFKKAASEMILSSEKVLSLIQSLEKKKKEVREVISGKFSKSKGTLRWPNDGRITARFGRQKHPQFNETIFRKGIEIAPAKGGEVRSVFDGTVVFADWFRGYGMMVMIDHGENYYSLYAHLAKLLVGVGDQVAKDRTIGEVGGTGLSREAKLYFEIRHQGEPTNPLSWLQKRK